MYDQIQLEKTKVNPSQHLKGLDFVNLQQVIKS